MAAAASLPGDHAARPGRGAAPPAVLAASAPDAPELPRRRAGGLAPDSPAYVIYTSGSTGKPKKGVSSIPDTAALANLLTGSVQR